LFASHAPIIEDIIIFEKEQRSRELEKELEATLNFLKITITSLEEKHVFSTALCD
jgi:hypothetical protein